MSTNPPKRLSLFCLEEKRQKIGVVLGPLLFLLTGLGLQSQGLSAPASWAAGTVAFMSCWWITEPVPLWATACLPLATFPIFSNAPFYGVLVQYFDPVNFLFLGGMWIAACMEQWGLHRRIALSIVAAIGVSPRRIVLGFMLGTGFMTLWISNTAAAMMMFPIAMAVLRKFEEQIPRGDPLLKSFGLALMLGIAYAASIGGIGTKIGTGTNLVFVKNAAEFLPTGVDFVTWLKMGLPVVVISIPLVWLYLVHFGAKLPNRSFPGGAETIRIERQGLGRMNRGEWVAAFAFSLAAFLWIFRKDIELGALTIPGWSHLVAWDWNAVLSLAEWPPAMAKLFNDTGDAMVAMVIALALFLIPVSRKPFTPALSVTKASGIAWGLLVLLGGGFAMAYGIQASGLSNTIAGSLKNIGELNPLTATLAVAFLAIALTEVASNTATASILLPILAVTAPSFGLAPLPIMLTATLAASFGFMLPAGTPPNAIAYASGYITVPQMVRSGIMVDLFGALIVTFVCYFIVPRILGL